MESLWLTGTNVTSLDALKGMKKLRELAINDTAVSSIEPLRGLTEIKMLYAHYSDIEDISPIEDMTKLEFLKLEGAKLTQLADVFAKLTQLKHVNICGLVLGEIPASLEKLGLHFVVDHNDEYVGRCVYMTDTILRDQSRDRFRTK